MGLLGIILIVVGGVVNIVAWVKKKRRWQAIGVLVSFGGFVLSLMSCMNPNFLA